MMLVELTSVPSAALPVSELAEHLRLPRGFVDDGAQDGRLEACLRGALSAVEARTAKAVFQRSFRLTLSAWHAEDAHGLPMAPVVAINAVTLVAPDGAEIVVDAAHYRLRPDTHGPAIVTTSAALPRPVQGGTLDVSFTAGYAVSWTEVPDDLKQAILLLAARFWAQDPVSETGLPVAVASLLEPYRGLRLGGAVT